MRAMAQRRGGGVPDVVRGAHCERPVRVLRLRGMSLLQRRVVRTACWRLGRRRRPRRAASSAAVGSLPVASLTTQPTAADSATAATASACVVHAGGDVGVGAVWPSRDDTSDSRHRQAQAVATRRHAVARLWLSQC